MTAVHVSSTFLYILQGRGKIHSYEKYGYILSYRMPAVHVRLRARCVCTLLHMRAWFDAPSCSHARGARTLLSLQGVGRRPAVPSYDWTKLPVYVPPPATSSDHWNAEPGGAGDAASLGLFEGGPASEAGHEDDPPSLEDWLRSAYDVTGSPPGMEALPTFSFPGENGMCTPLACDCARQPVFTPAVSFRFLLVPELVNKLTDMFVAEHDVFLAGKAEREAEHEGRLHRASATKKDVQSIGTACASQHAVVNKAMNAITNGGLAILDTEEDPFERQNRLMVCACADCVLGCAHASCTHAPLVHRRRRLLHMRSRVRRGGSVPMPCGSRHASAKQALVDVRSACTCGGVECKDRADIARGCNPSAGTGTHVACRSIPPPPAHDNVIGIQHLSIRACPQEPLMMGQEYALVHAQPFLHTSVHKV